MAEDTKAAVVAALTKEVGSDPLNRVHDMRYRGPKMPGKPNGPKKAYKGDYIGPDENKGKAIPGKHKGKYAGPDKYMGLARGPKRKELMDAAKRKTEKGKFYGPDGNKGKKPSGSSNVRHPGDDPTKAYAL